MMKRFAALALLLAPVTLLAQAPQAQPTQSTGGLDPAAILKPLAESWPTYSGDYTGRRYSSLTQINQTTIKSLGLAWISRGFVQGSGPTGRGPGNAAASGGGGGGRGGGGPEAQLIVAGEGTGDYNGGGPAQIRGSILAVDGILYATRPTTCGRSTRATERFSGSSTGRPVEARIPAIAVWACGTTTCSWRRTTIT